MKEPIAQGALDPESAAQLLSTLATLDPKRQEEAMALMDKIIRSREILSCQDQFIPFVKRMWPGFISGRHHRIMAEVFEKIARGELKRVCISMPPRHTKSEFASYLLPSWFLGKFPGKKVIQASHTAELAVGFGRKVRNLVGSPPYAEVFPGVKLQVDSKAAGRWATNQGGEYYAVGVGGAMTGKGADLLIIDDPHDEQEAALAAYDPTVFDKAYEWYTSGPRQRLQPGGAIVIVQTRWSKRDLIGRVLEAHQARGGDQWEIIEFPAIMPSGNPLWPEFWPLEELLATKANISPVKWNAQYMQQPTSEEGALVKREWWKPWGGPPPKRSDCEFVIQSWDTAYRVTNRSDYSVCTTWAITEHDGRKVMVLMDLFRDRLEFPELKKAALKLYNRWKPDSCIIEAKGSGDSLVQELRRMGLPLSAYTPARGEDKITRVNAVADMFASGLVWAPYDKYVPGAAELIQEFADFPNGSHDDMVDSTTLAMMRFRQGNFVWIDTDIEPDDPSKYDYKADYY